MLAGLEAFLHVLLLGDTKLWEVWVLGKASTPLPGVDCRRWCHTHVHLNNRTENKKTKLSNLYALYTDLILHKNLHVARSEGADLLLKPLNHARKGHVASGE